MEKENNKLSSVDRGERALEESTAMVACLIEACEGQGAFHMPQIAVMLGKVMSSLNEAQQALQDIAGAL